MKNRISFVICLLLLSALTADAQKYMLHSPDNKFKVEISVNDSISYDVSFSNTPVILPSCISMTLDKGLLGKSSKVLRTKSRKEDTVLFPPFGKNSKLRVQYNEFLIDFAGSYSVIFRAYNEGVAYRFVTRFKDSVKVTMERADFNLAGSPAAILPETDNYTSWEVPYVEYASMEMIGDGKRALTPSLFTYAKPGIRVLIAESDLFDYPGMYVQKKSGNMTGNWAAYPARTEMGSWGNFVSVVKERAGFLALTKGSRNYPWRVIIATDDDKSLLTNELVYKLARPSQIETTSWIKPGKAAWEWWHDALLPAGKIPSGMDNRNMTLYNYYTDFAAANKLEYLMIDAGWSNVYTITQPNDKVNIKEVIKHASEKNVGVFLWCVASALMKDLDHNLDYLRELGAAGIKVDFFDRDDQLAIQMMEDIGRAAAKRKLMVDFHGCGKPAGIQRTWPNAINFEAVRGAECSKWDYTANPRHHLVIPFIRMPAGPFDYTPGGMRNKTKELFKPIDPGLPSTQGTRCHELAMYVVFDQPLGMLCDSPDEYSKYPDILRFLSAVPASFDETKVLDARLGEHVAIAKRKKDDWFIGAMCDWTPANLSIELSFLPKGVSYEASVYTDGSNAAKNAEDYTYKVISVTSQSKINLPLAAGGGAVISLHKK